MNKKTLPSQDKILIAGLAALILFFCISAAVCIHLFMKAADTADNAEALDRAVMETTSIADSLKASQGDTHKAVSLLKGRMACDIEDSSFALSYDENFNPASKGGARYTASVQVKKYTNYNQYKIIFKDNTNESVLYSLSFKALNGSGGDSN